MMVLVTVTVPVRCTVVRARGISGVAMAVKGHWEVRRQQMCETLLAGWAEEEEEGDKAFLWRVGVKDSGKDEASCRLPSC
jgi:hypothetical protein